MTSIWNILTSASKPSTHKRFEILGVLNLRLAQILKEERTCKGKNGTSDKSKFTFREDKTQFWRIKDVNFFHYLSFYQFSGVHNIIIFILLSHPHHSLNFCGGLQPCNFSRHWNSNSESLNSFYKYIARIRFQNQFRFSKSNLVQWLRWYISFAWEIIVSNSIIYIKD